MELPQYPRCPFVRGGLGAALLRACPGFEEQSVTFDGVEVPGGYPGKRMPSGVSCSHLGLGVSSRGWRSECRHPRGLPPLWGDRTIEVTGHMETMTAPASGD